MWAKFLTFDDYGKLKIKTQFLFNMNTEMMNLSGCGENQVTVFFNSAIND